MKSLIFREANNLWGEGLFLSHVVAFNEKNQPCCLKCHTIFETEIKTCCFPEGFEDADEAPITLFQRVCAFFKRK